ncbi:MAG TPA: 2-isopropylmalate synthase [Polyangiaceae bacterium]|nr:2-isopropylmalate synthase [Polyangiaceae bacterium]
MSQRVVIFDTTLRDGEQSAGVCFSVTDKIDIATELARAHVDVIEVGYPAASAVEYEAVRRVAEHVRSSAICALARCVPGDIDVAADALRGAAHPRLHLFLSSSDVQLSHQLRKDRSSVLLLASTMVKAARARVSDVEFSPMDATRADPEFLAAVVRSALHAGATTINIPDTVGYSLPDQLARRIARLLSDVPELAGATLSFHGQDDLGLATANAIAAVSSGARQVEVAVNGIGERAGNTSFEEVVMAIRVHGEALGVTTGVDASRIYELSKLVEERSGIAVPSNKAIVGKNAFRHASGIHQDGVLKRRETFEVIDPASIGHPRGSEIVLGKLSGRAGFRSRARELGFELEGREFEAAFAAFQAVADQRREVDREEVARICRALQDASDPSPADLVAPLAPLE